MKGMQPPSAYSALFGREKGGPEELQAVLDALLLAYLSLTTSFAHGDANGSTEIAAARHEWDLVIMAALKQFSSPASNGEESPKWPQ